MTCPLRVGLPDRTTHPEAGKLCGANSSQRYVTRRVHVLGKYCVMRVISTVIIRRRCLDRIKETWRS